MAGGAFFGIGDLLAGVDLLLVEDFVAQIVLVDRLGELLLLLLPGVHLRVRQLALHGLLREARLLDGGGLEDGGLFEGLVLFDHLGDEFARLLGGGVEGGDGLLGEAAAFVGVRGGGDFGRRVGRLGNGGLRDVAEIFGDAGEESLFGGLRGLLRFLDGLGRDGFGGLDGLVKGGVVDLVRDGGQLAGGLLQAAGGRFEEVREGFALGDADLVGEGALLAVVEIDGDDAALRDVGAAEVGRQGVGDLEPDAEAPGAAELEFGERKVVGDVPGAPAAFVRFGFEVEVPGDAVVVREDGEAGLREAVVVGELVDEAQEAEGGERVGVARRIGQLDMGGVVGAGFVGGPVEDVGEAPSVAEREGPAFGALWRLDEPVEGDFVGRQAFGGGEAAAAEEEGGVHPAVEAGANAGSGADGGGEGRGGGGRELRGAEARVGGVVEADVQPAVGGRRDGRDGVAAREGVAEAHAVAEGVADGGHFELEEGLGVVESETAGEALDGERLAGALDPEFGAGSALAGGGEGEEDGLALDDRDVARRHREGAGGEIVERGAGGDGAGEEKGGLARPADEEDGEDGDDEGGGEGDGAERRAAELGLRGDARDVGGGVRGEDFEELPGAFGGGAAARAEKFEGGADALLEFGVAGFDDARHADGGEAVG